MVQVVISDKGGREYPLYRKERTGDRIRAIFFLLREGKTVYLDYGIYRIEHVEGKVYRLSVLDNGKFKSFLYKEFIIYGYLLASSIISFKGSKYQQYGNVRADKASRILKQLEKGNLYRLTGQMEKYQALLQLALKYGFNNIGEAIVSFTNTVNGEYWTAPPSREYPRHGELAK